MPCELNAPADAAPSLLQALGSVAVGSLAGLVSGVLICAVVVQLAGCAAAGLTVAAVAPAGAAAPEASDASDASDASVAAAAASADDACDPRARLCR
jgi:hypothetical protein